VNIWEEKPKTATIEETSQALKLLDKLDKSSMKDVVLEMPNQITAAFKASANYNEGEKPSDRSRIYLFGIGGSAISGDLISDILSPQNKITVCRGTPPPRDMRGVVISSYSGNTKEITSEVHRVTGGLKSNIFITSGGNLARLAWEWTLPIWRIPEGYQPRGAIGWSMGLLVRAMVRWRILNVNVQNKLEQAAKHLADNLAQVDLIDHTVIQSALSIAQSLIGKNVLIFHSSSCVGAAMRLAAQINENGKHPAFTVSVPEGLHNSIEGIAGGDPNAWSLIFIFDPSDPLLLRERLARSAEYLQEKEYTSLQFPAFGNDRFELTLYRVLLADFVSLFLATLKGVDPTPIPTITALKQDNASVNEQSEG